MLQHSLFVEQDTGVEPAFTAWEAVVLPIYESCALCEYYSKGQWKIQPLFVTQSGYNRLHDFICRRNSTIAAVRETAA